MRTWFVIALVLIALSASGFFVYSQNTDDGPREAARGSGPEPVTAAVTLPAGSSREAIAARIGDALGYSEEKTHQLHDTYRAMQWRALNGVLVPYLVAEHDLDEDVREVLLTHSSIYLDTEDDILESVYVPDTYTLTSDDTVAEIAEALIEPVAAVASSSTIDQYLTATATEELLEYVRRETELLPDIIPLPPQDVGIRERGGRTLLVFTTVYYNAGRGPLELRADPSTVNVPGDVVRDVHQRIYRPDGTYRQHEAGSFEWHHEHLHYHFSDFVEYRLTSATGTEAASADLAEKSTFCIRDVSRVHYDGAPSSTVEYRICGRERQGISVGWGDAYFHTYPDQNFDITGLSSGTYTLRFFANPEDRFDEITTENNAASATFLYNAEAGTVEVMETEPRDTPPFDHIYTEDIYP